MLINTKFLFQFRIFFSHTQQQRPDFAKSFFSGFADFVMSLLHHVEINYSLLYVLFDVYLTRSKILITWSVFHKFSTLTTNNIIWYMARPFSFIFSLFIGVLFTKKNSSILKEDMKSFLTWLKLFSLRKKQNKK